MPRTNTNWQKKRKACSTWKYNTYNLSLLHFLTNSDFRSSFRQKGKSLKILTQAGLNVLSTDPKINKMQQKNPYWYSNKSMPRIPKGQSHVNVISACIEWRVHVLPLCRRSPYPTICTRNVIGPERTQTGDPSARRDRGCIWQ